jgi:hypothetical protein
MDTNNILKDIHAALVEKAAAKCRVEGSAATAIRIGRDIVAYGQTWIDAFADDGKISEAEKDNILAAFSDVVEKHLPPVDNSAVKIAWNGLSIFGIGWAGLRSKLNDWFGLKL